MPTSTGPDCCGTMLPGPLHVLRLGLAVPPAAATIVRAGCTAGTFTALLPCSALANPSEWRLMVADRLSLCTTAPSAAACTTVSSVR